MHRNWFRRFAHRIPPTTIALALTAAGLQAQQTGTISGRVIVESSTQPIEGAQVYLVGTTLGTRTSANGRYTIANVPAAQTTPAASGPRVSITSPAEGDTIPGDSVTVVMAVEGVKLVPAAAAQIEGEGHLHLFVDVPVTHFAWRYVEAVHGAGVTAGCGGPPARYCPDGNVTRAQMAVFLEDLGSANGTYIRIRGSAEVRGRDTFRIGDQILRLRLDR